MEVSSKPEWPGARRVGRYVLYDVIASGGMASVHLARLHGAVGFSRIVAVKSIHPHIAREPDFVAMFLDEARLASRIRHANVVSPLDVVVDGEDLFLVLEYVAGQSLAELLEFCRERGERVPQGIALRIVGDALQGLQAAHDARDERGQPLGLVHRDVSPHNLLVGVDGVARVADFGVAKAFGRLQTTRSGQLKGKLGYMAPEQLQGQVVTPRSDVYSAAVTLWELLAGQRFIDADTEAELVLKSVAGPLPELRQARPDVPEALCAVVERGLHREPARRYESAVAFVEALEDVAALAAAREVSRWMHHVAAPALEARAELVAAIEQRVGLPASRPPPPTGTTPEGDGSTEPRSRRLPPTREADGTPLGLARSSQAPRGHVPVASSRVRSLLSIPVVLLGFAGIWWMSAGTEDSPGIGEETAPSGVAVQEEASGPGTLLPRSLLPRTLLPRTEPSTGGRPMLEQPLREQPVSEQPPIEPARVEPRSVPVEGSATVSDEAAVESSPARATPPPQPPKSKARPRTDDVPKKDAPPGAPPPVPDDLLGRH